MEKREREGRDVEGRLGREGGVTEGNENKETKMEREGRYDKKKRESTVREKQSEIENGNKRYLKMK